MKSKKYNKLVRDRIPEIIKANGQSCVTEILSHEDYLMSATAVRFQSRFVRIFFVLSFAT